MRARRGGLTASDKVVAECLVESAWALYEQAVLGRWSAACDSLQSALGLYGLHRN